MSAPLLETRELSVRFCRDRSVRPALEGLSYTLAGGETLAIVGESGSGKTVGCRALVGLLPPSARITGSVRLQGQEILTLGERQMRAIRGGQIGMIFQDPARALDPTMRIGNQILETLRQHERLDRSSARQRALQLLDELRLNAPEEQFLAFPHQLSGGMQQRAMIAIALAANPKVLIADEATRSLDIITRGQVLHTLTELQRRRHMALILITHDLVCAAHLATHVIVMHEGRAVEQGTPAKIFAHPASDCTRALLDSMPGAVRDAIYSREYRVERVGS